MRTPCDEIKEGALSGMKWNTIATVVDIVEAPTAEAAAEALEERLRELGFDVYDGDTDGQEQAFPVEE